MFHVLGDGKILDELVVDPFVKEGERQSLEEYKWY